MFLSTAFKSLLLLYILCGLTACGYWSGGSGDNVKGPAAFSPQDIKSDIPFSTKEPEVYQAEIVTTVDGGERKVFVARSGTLRLMLFSYGEKTEVGRLESSGKTVSFSRSAKVYTELTGGVNLPADDSPESSLALGRLNSNIGSQFEEKETENNVTRYVVRTGNSESDIFVDKNLNLPVRQEYYDSAHAVTLKTEMRNVRLEADSALFSLPPNLKKVTAKEFQDILWRQKND
jgi:predicted small lipoprotein YifL